MTSKDIHPLSVNCPFSTCHASPGEHCSVAGDARTRPQGGFHPSRVKAAHELSERHQGS